MHRADFTQRSVFVTGGSKGIGLEMALEFAKRGARVAIAARTQDTLDDAIRLLAQHQLEEHLRSYVCDVTDAAQIEGCIRDAHECFGSLDGVVTNAGSCHPGNFHELSIDVFDKQIDTNLKGAIYTLRAAIPFVLESRGFIAITSSPAGRVGFFGFGAYGPTKAALINLSEVLRSEYCDSGVSVHLLLPPDTDTPGYAEELKLYPPETKAILGGGSLHKSNDVARIFVDGIAKGKNVIAIGAATKFLFAVLRFAPFVWTAHVRLAKRQARRQRLASKT